VVEWGIMLPAITLGLALAVFLLRLLDVDPTSLAASAWQVVAEQLSGWGAHQAAGFGADWKIDIGGVVGVVVISFLGGLFVGWIIHRLIRDTNWYKNDFYLREINAACGLLVYANSSEDYGGPHKEYLVKCLITYIYAINRSGDEKAFIKVNALIGSLLKRDIHKLARMLTISKEFLTGISDEAWKNIKDDITDVLIGISYFKEPPSQTTPPLPPSQPGQRGLNPVRRQDGSNPPPVL
jgi:hypothetical protein